MRKSLISSFALHGAILVAALVVLPTPKQFDVKPQESIQVDISNIGDATKKKATAKEVAPPEKKVAPKKVEVVKKVEPAPKVAEEVVASAKAAEVEPPPLDLKKLPDPPKEVPKPVDNDALAKLTADAAKPLPPKNPEEKKPEKKPAAKKPEKKKETLDMKALEAAVNDLNLDKSHDEKTAPQQVTEVAGAPEQAENDAQGTDDAASATLRDALSKKLHECWSIPPAVSQLDITVSVRFQLNEDGSVAGVPDVLNSNSDPLFDLTARSAVSAVMGCPNFSDIFPLDKYELWKENTFDFNPIR